MWFPVLFIKYFSKLTYLETNTLFSKYFECWTYFLVSRVVAVKCIHAVKSLILDLATSET
jgi:hypothetical protein